MRHLTARFAWHDNKWNGTVCKDPYNNLYCVDNYSLLSSRIQRRRDVELEEKYKGEDFSSIVNKSNYVPPCYWCINLFGDNECRIEDTHPFCDTWIKFEDVPPIKETIKPYSIFTWNFNLSFNTDGKYKYPPDLEERVEKYIDQIESKKSITFFYANYSNPITGDERKYLILGAGLVRENVKFPQRYEIPSDLYEEVNEDRPVFPTVAWQFQVPLDPETAFILPYHDYINWIEEDGSDKDEKERMLDEVAVKVEDSTIIPHFKYVSMHLPHDKAIYLLYKIKKSVKKIKEDGVAPIDEVRDVESKVNKLLETAWELRRECPGLKNLLRTLLRNDFDKEALEKITTKVESKIKEEFGEVSEFLRDENNVNSLTVDDNELENVFRVIKRRFDLIAYLSRFDFSKKEFQNIIDLVGKHGLEVFKLNPYILLENYPYDIKADDWDIEENDYGVSVYQLDIALIPDPTYVSWKRISDSRSPERVRALITKILNDAAQNEGHTYLTRDEILERIRDYPLYYIQEEFELDQLLLKDYESNPKFKELFTIRHVEGETVYQLKSLGKIENIIERFLKTLEPKKHDFANEELEALVNRDLERFKEQIKDQVNDFKEERSQLYRKTLGNGLAVISGKAGSGKTSAIINLVQEFKRQKKSPILVFTPTGKANLVIRNRLKEIKLHNEFGINVSTIHWFIYGALIDSGKKLSGNKLNEVFELVGLASKILEGHYELIYDFEKKARRWQFNPRVVIIDEASMTDELTLSLLLCLINPGTLKHLIVIGDDKQLPPIGLGRPFIDILHYLKKQGLEENSHHLSTNLRFSSQGAELTKTEKMAELFRDEREPLPDELEHIISSSDATFKLRYFNDMEDLKNSLREILDSSNKEGKSIHELFKDVFEPDSGFEFENLEKVQVLAPKRVGKFGTLAINVKAILGREQLSRIPPGTKVICEENQYWKIKGKKMLALANGSIGYLDSNGYYVRFADFDGLLDLYAGDKQSKYQILNSIKDVRKELTSYEKNETSFSPAYAITVHKSQGSDFDDVVFVFSEQSPFVSRELLYTGFTRAKKRVHFMVHENLKNDLYDSIFKAFKNSSIEQINTLLLGYKYSPFRPYVVHKKDGEKISVRSKIEYMIAKTLDNLEIEFEYEPQDFSTERVYPDFKIYSDSGTFYWEHLGLLNKRGF